MNMLDPRKSAGVLSRIRLATIAVLLVPLLWAGDIDAQTAKTTTYKYDALGRLTFVEDSVNGNRDYDYDAAGNRRNVAVNQANDAASEPGPLPPPPYPAAPTGLGINQVADCAWNATWNSVQGATSYSLGDTGGATYSTTFTNKSVPCPQGNPQGNKPQWVRACNPNMCGPYSYF